MTELSDEGSPISKRDRVPTGVCAWLATGGYVGLAPIASGTVGALWGLPLALGINHIPSVLAQVVIIVTLCALGVPLCTKVAHQLGRKDPGAIVWDEIVSVPITFFLVPVDKMWSPLVLGAGFLLNRAFDITKPPPARQLESLPDGLGVMADDWAAGVYSCIALHILMWISVIV